MPEQIDMQTELVSDAMLEDAALWAIRLREAQNQDMSDANGLAVMQGEYEAWLAADPLHEQAAREMGAVWSLTERPAKTLVSAANDEAAMNKVVALRPWFRSPVAGIALAACFAVLMVLGVFQQQQIATMLFADLATGVGEQNQTTLQDGSVVTLNTASAISVEISDTSRHITLLKGEAWFDVAKDPTRPFTVETSYGLITVTGTQFGVNMGSASTQVHLVEGSIELGLPEDDAPSLSLVPGQGVVLTSTGYEPVFELDPFEAQAWLRGQILFFETPLSEAIATLNRYRPGHIVIADGDLADRKVSGAFSSKDPEAVLSAIASTLNAETMQVPGLITVLH